MSILCTGWVYQPSFLEEKVLQLHTLLKSKKFTLTNEKTTQAEIGDVLRYHGVSFFREHRFDDKNIVDFWCAPGIALEIKLKAPKKAIYKQCERYSKFDDVRAIYLVTNTSLGFPCSLNGKPTFVFNLGQSWL